VVDGPTNSNEEKSKRQQEIIPENQKRRGTKRKEEGNIYGD